MERIRLVMAKAVEIMVEQSETIGGKTGEITRVLAKFDYEVSSGHKSKSAKRRRIRARDTPKDGEKSVESNGYIVRLIRANGTARTREKDELLRCDHNTE